MFGCYDAFELKLRTINFTEDPVSFQGRVVWRLIGSGGVRLILNPYARLNHKVENPERPELLIAC